MSNKLKWYDWIPIIGVFTVRCRDSKFKNESSLLCWVFCQMIISFLLPLKEIKDLL